MRAPALGAGRASSSWCTPRARALMQGRPAADMSDLRAVAPAVPAPIDPELPGGVEGLTGADVALRLIA